MIEDQDQLNEDRIAAALLQSVAPASTRREFIIGVGRKAAYMTPVLLTLSATPAVASPHSVSCKPLAGSCSSNSDCCSNNCSNNLCA